ncbi:MAG: adenylate/guanylate cyclase domain-containing protein [Candidatus Nitrosopumilus limneticus]|nr:Adenylate cyclase [Candidatus Nitrosopumilus limneticus]MDC4212481.1 adenylate/guanylate cyclase domain-containing protein [Candidatus Nitrosopumilus limneticus]MDC4213499.1 adenylate/guanylate cyclase domain-containing protein [Candidatus Nitrosopumilus limneticus]MDC4215852.1 adenylate/guanylate cyclase domain-containing protein [Candidatus Nitrosopumilus limneticus]MDC4216756.1 adenylate/guanylate cyclase domain-containing protein [Candidatus Nitrosopumilus limneticus]
MTEKIDSAENNVVDMLLSRNVEEVIDFDSMILDTQKRVWGSLKTGYEYSGVVNESDTYLRKHVFCKLDMVVLYVDLVGSTTMALELPPEKIAIIISSFSQEMGSVIRQHHGYVLKFVGDAVIGYFVAENDSLLTTANAVNCAKSMISVIQKGINPILNQYDYPDLKVKIGVDFGQNIIVRYGADKVNSHVDLIGPVMNISAKIQSMAKPNQILIGSDVYDRLHPNSQKEYKQIIWKNDEWKYRSRLSGEIYKVYEFEG